METRLRASYAQFAALLEFMERYGDIGQPQSGPQGRIRADQKWQQLTHMLNAIGGGVRRTPDKWKKVWADWKSKTKKKAGTIRQHASGTGGGPATNKTLSALEERVVALLGDTALSGQPGIEEQGFNRVSQPSEIHFLLSEDINVDDENTLPVSALPQVSTPPAPPVTRTSIAPREGDQETSPGPSGLCHTPTRAQATTSSSAQRPRLEASPQSGASTPRRSRRLLRPRPATLVQSAASTPRRRLQPRQLTSPRRRSTRTQTPFQRAASEFAAIEMRRLELEHEREARRIEVDREHNELLRKIIDIAQTLVEAYTGRRGGV